MEIAELVLRYLQALAWPGVAITGVFVFRRQLTSVFARITEASLFGASVKLQESAKRAATESEEIPELSDPLAKIEKVEKVKDIDAAAGSMLRSWSAIESVTEKIGHSLGLSGQEARSVPRVIRKLSASDLISREAANVAKDLQSIRNQVAHGAPGIELTQSVADDFVEAAEQLRVALVVTLGRVHIERSLMEKTPH
ncbi:hypothetical protein FB472_2653 [Rhodoglobus vestalii]|uniref:Uncharacterized protein n=1 Tax=Rhodoglobus vestalii TaxID=193384 RepID=A0A8H2PVL7_9MICO|nr:hypothetical protein [Rhodoglobus vestalii]TQO20992.1 hypothetical protein FB472_2653 [Rhodoglobus vestalii]